MAELTAEIVEVYNQALRDLGGLCRHQAVEFRRLAMRAQGDSAGAAYALGAAAALEAVANVFEAR